MFFDTFYDFPGCIRCKDILHIHLETFKRTSWRDMSLFYFNWEYFEDRNNNTECSKQISDVTDILLNCKAYFCNLSGKKIISKIGISFFSWQQSMVYSMEQKHGINYLKDIWRNWKREIRQKYLSNIETNQ